MCNNILQTVHSSWNDKLAELAKLLTNFFRSVLASFNFKFKIFIHYGIIFRHVEISTEYFQGNLLT